MKKLLCMIIAISLCLSTPMTAYAAKEPSVLPSGTAYNDIEAKIDAYVKEHESTTAALSVAVLNRNEVLLEKAYGYIDIEDKEANDENSVFEWGSCTKLLIWVSAMQLSDLARKAAWH